MKRLGMLMLLLGLTGGLCAEVVVLTDGTKLRGAVETLENGDVVVDTAAGKITVAKDKIASTMTDSVPAGETGRDGGEAYIRKVMQNREKFGNADGVRHTTVLNNLQLAFTLGMLNYTGDALDIVNPSDGSVLVSTGGLSGMNFGLNLVNNVSDWIGWELWSGVTFSEKGFTLGGVSSKVSATRVDVGLAPRIQTSILMGEQGMHFIPYIGMGPVYTYTNYATQLIAGGTAVAGNAASSAVGMSMNVGADVQLGNALIGLKFKYILSRDLSGGLKSNDMSAMLPSLSVGWAF